MAWIGDPFLPPLRVYVYEMPKKSTYDLLTLFRNTYRETSNLTSNGSPEALNWVTDRPAWKRSEGRDHILPVHHPWSFKSVRRYMKNAIGCYQLWTPQGTEYKLGWTNQVADALSRKAELAAFKCEEVAATSRVTSTLPHCIRDGLEKGPVRSLLHQAKEWKTRLGSRMGSCFLLSPSLNFMLMLKRLAAKWEKAMEEEKLYATTTGLYRLPFLIARGRSGKVLVGLIKERCGGCVGFDDGGSMTTKVASIIHNEEWVWPNSRCAITREIIAGTAPSLVPDPSAPDSVRCCGSDPR
ncbi:hypothetical protein RHSIM_Rhsim05G0022200 [Rhododendron simsii]|uniref:Uncharacterized protein n=1 Tax=Rhododendron simsii TaxID=118357 RepID=A0A834LKU1_RHOSS|nr:hypothetical protein RHSIM_Rhsim05G0022200 [Rhododendron simsii]